MSAWRLIVQRIHREGPIRGETADSKALTAARDYKLIEHSERQQWRLTTLGLDYCENRVALVRVRPGGTRFMPTWLRSLPRGLRLDLNSITFPAS